MRLDELPPYVPAWPSYLARRLTDAVLTGPGVQFDLASHGMAAYRILTVVGGREVSVILPVPEDFPQPLTEPEVVAALGAVVARMRATA
jgi:hypothetical protein